jgi:hypothetical protein
VKVISGFVIALTVTAVGPGVADAAPADTEGSATMNAQAEFPEIHWEEMRAKMEAGGADAVADFVAGFNDEERRKLYAFAQIAFYGRDWEGKGFDGYIEIADAGIAEGVRQAEAESDAAKAAKLLDYANVMSYNLSADLAECWPGDTLPRDKRHLEAGLKAAEDCIRWREELGKGPEPFGMAYWAKGMHQLSLGDAAGAVKSFEKSFGYYVAAEVSPEAGFGIILAEGYVGLAEWAAGDEAGKERYDNAVAAFREGAEKYPDKKDDFDFGVDQLEWVKGKFIK